MIIFAIIFLAIGTPIVMEGYTLSDKGNKILGFIICIVFVLTLVSTKLFFTNEVEYTPITENDIYSVSNDTHINGEFILGTGKIEENIVYVVLLKDDYGYYQKIYNKADYKNIYIIETDEVTPKIEICKTRSTSNLANIWYSVGMRDVVFIYIPTNSIIINYEID